MKVASAQYGFVKHESLEAWKTHTENWVKEASENQARLLLFPEYGSIELVSILPREIQKDLSKQLLALQNYREEFVIHYQSLALLYEVTIIAPSFPWQINEKTIVNRAFIFSKDGDIDFQDKQVMTRFEEELWHVSSPTKNHLTIFDVDQVKCGISICFDVEFPDFARLLAKKGVKVLLAPSCTETLAGMNRVHIGARARALENQFYVIVAQTVGLVDYSEAIDFNTGMAAVYSPCDKHFPEDGILCTGPLNESQWLYTELNLESIELVRTQGAVLNFQKMLSLNN